MSTTTTELSVSIPTPIESPISEIKLRVVPLIDRKAKVNTIATGSATEINTVVLKLFKKANNIIVASTSPCTAELETFEIELLIFSEASISILYSVPAGIYGFISSIALKAALFNVIVSPSEDFCNRTTIASLPLRYPTLSASSVVKTTSATSFNLKVLPLELINIFLY